MGTFKTFFDPRYRPPTPVLVDSEVRGTTLQKLIVDSEVRGTTPQKLIVKVKWKVKSEKVKKWKKWSESIFGPLNLFIFGYVKGEVLGNNNIGIKKCTTTFLWVLNFGEVGEILENFQKHPLGESFWKMVSKVIFWKNYKEISL